MAWTKKRLGDVCTIINGKNQKDVIDINGKYPIFGSAGNVMGYANKYLCDQGTVIIGRKGNISTPIFIDEPFWNVDTAFGIYPKEKLMLPKFNYYQCLNIDFKSRNKGTTIPSLVKTDLLTIDIYTTDSIPEQQAIVEKLDFAFDAIEKAKANIERNIENAKELFQSKLNEIFSQKGEGNKKWVFKKLSDIFDVRDGTHDSPKYQESGFALVTSKNLKKGKITLDKIKFICEKDYININKRSNVSKGDILFAMIGTIGNPVVIMEEPDFAIKNVALIKSNKENNSYFFSYYLDLEMVIKKMQDESKGTTQRFVSLGYMRNFEVPCPKIEIQNKIVKQIDLLSEQTNLLQEKYKQKLANLEELKKSILEKAFKGELI